LRNQARRISKAARVWSVLSRTITGPVEGNLYDSQVFQLGVFLHYLLLSARYVESYIMEEHQLVI